jgi:hypothetical protein
LRRLAGLAVGRGQAQARECGIAGGRAAGDLLQSLLRLGLLVLSRFPSRRGETRPGRLGGLDAAVLVILEAADAGDDEDGRRDEVGAVLLPQLEELLAPELLVDLPGQAVALVHHARPASPAALLELLGAS